MKTEFPPAIVIARSFGEYNKGDLITDASTIRAIMTGGNVLHIVVPVLPEVAMPIEADKR